MSKGFTYIWLTLIIFTILLVLIFYPYNLPKSPGFNANCFVGQAPGGDIQKKLPAIKGRDENTGGPDLSKLVPYKLLRRNVPAEIEDFFDNSEHEMFWQNTPDNKFAIWYPTRFGEKDFYRSFVSPRYNTDGNQFRLRHEGIVIFVHLDNQGQVVTLAGGKEYLVDIYQQTEIYNLSKAQKGYETDEIFICTPPDKTKLERQLNDTIKVKVPEPQVRSADNKQLQLEWFLFGSEGKISLKVHCKPAIYLYPKQTQMVNVKVFPKGFLSYTDPIYDSQNGWIVEANPNGDLLTSNSLDARRYSYLYYESKIKDNYLKIPEQGFVVQYSELNSLYQDLLPRLGLNPKESRDFITYWTKALPKANYYFVGIIDQKQKDFIEPLEVIPTPDTSIRFSLYFQPLESKVQVVAPTISTPKRNGFTLVEWGGMIKRDKDHPFTCSQ